MLSWRSEAEPGQLCTSFRAALLNAAKELERLIMGISVALVTCCMRFFHLCGNGLWRKWGEPRRKKLTFAALMFPVWTFRPDSLFTFWSAETQHAQEVTSSTHSVLLF